jgi:type II secretory pathway component PulK
MTVLLMVFVALLGTTFVAVVQVNIHSSTRSDHKAEAQIAARAGMRLMKQRVAQEGLNWRPKDKDPAQQTRPQAKRLLIATYYEI